MSENGTAEEGGTETRLFAQERSLELPATLDLSGWHAVQVAAMTWYAQPTFKRVPSTARALCQQLGIGSSTLYEWRRQPGWDEAVTEIARANLSRYRPNAYGALVKQMEAGDMKAVRLFFELLGDIGPEGKNANVNTTIQLAIVNDSEGQGQGGRLLTVDTDGGQDGETEAE